MKDTCHLGSMYLSDMSYVQCMVRAASSQEITQFKRLGGELELRVYTLLHTVILSYSPSASWHIRREMKDLVLFII